jgi:hypothetical protein
MYVVLNRNVYIVTWRLKAGIVEQDFDFEMSQ